MMSGHLAISPNKSLVTFSKNGEEVKVREVRKYASNMTLPIQSQLSQIIESAPDKEKWNFNYG